MACYTMRIICCCITCCCVTCCCTTDCCVMCYVTWLLCHVAVVSRGCCVTWLLCHAAVVSRGCCVTRLLCHVAVVSRGCCADVRPVITCCNFLIQDLTLFMHNVNTRTIVAPFKLLQRAFDNVCRVHLLHLYI